MMFVGQPTPFGIVVAAGINPEFTGAKRDKVYFAFHDFSGGYILRQAFNVIYNMELENDPRVPVWNDWLTKNFGTLSFFEEVYDDHTDAAADDEANEVSAQKSAAAGKWVQRELL
jgi:hypothetical protein